MRPFVFLVGFLVGAHSVFANNTPSTTTAPSLRLKEIGSVNGSEFKWIGTTAYWLPTLNTEQDIIDTLSNMSAAGITVVKTWPLMTLKPFQRTNVVPVDH
ncbi:hypothetical protein VKT23_014574 [Stygiomarasmius scandens]|uniref:Uncharacterized protein n=1 Tax=Marasmiellus scandens TaxID=2682957 RepID=A0ABR1J073_9AGAR